MLSSSDNNPVARDHLLELLGAGEFSRLTEASRMKAQPDKAFRKAYVGRRTSSGADILGEIRALVALEGRHCCRLAFIEMSGNTEDSFVSALVLHHEGSDLREVLRRSHSLSKGSENKYSFCRGGSSSLDSSSRLSIMLDLTRAMEFIHHHGWAHLDIKPENLLISDTDFSLRVADFGYAQKPPASHLAKRVGSPGFVAPEVRLSTSSRVYDGKCADIFSVGVTCIELFLGCDSFDELWLGNCSSSDGLEDSQEISRRTLKAMRAVKSLISPRYNQPTAEGSEEQADTKINVSRKDRIWQECAYTVFRRSVVMNPSTRWDSVAMLACVEGLAATAALENEDK